MRSWKTNKTDTLILLADYNQDFSSNWLVILICLFIWWLLYTWWYRYTKAYLIFLDPAGAGSRWGSRRDPCQSPELWQHLPGEGEDHRAGVQESALLPETHGGQRRTRLDLAYVWISLTPSTYDSLQQEHFQKLLNFMKVSRINGSLY